MSTPPPAQLIEAVFTAPPDVDLDDAMTIRILDAALREFQSFGLRRATVEDIARKAKVGRMTLHRRFASKQDLIAAVFLLEIRRVLDEVSAVIAQHDTLEDRLVEGLSFGITRTADDPLFSRLLDADREAMLPYLTVDADALMRASSTFVAAEIRRAVGDHPDADRIGEAIIRCSHSILLTPSGTDDLRDPAELRGFMRLAITALLQAVGRV